MFDTHGAEGGLPADAGGPRPWQRIWDRALVALVLVRLGQELGSDTRTAQAVATTIDFIVNVVGKVL